MKPVITLSFVAVVIFACLSFSFHTDSTRMDAAKINEGFAVVELFTSEGCSSCPPADEVMAKMAKEFSGNVYFLGYHVDYWNYIGWNDPFSKAEFTERQRRYAEIFGLESIYTPQVVVNGRNEFVGSKEHLLRMAIQDGISAPAGLVISIETTGMNDEHISVSCRAGKDPGLLLNIALVQKKAITNVKRGENGGRKLEHINVVRELKSFTAGNNETITAGFKIPSGLTVKDMQLIAFLQDKKDLTIKGVSAISF
ncbi:MAG: DUF1223 domain-containing protein [Chitinophagaceae bacterium]|nr:DUF1223 domain-containing protein [Chitinophagaceae bacterium]